MEDWCRKRLILSCIPNMLWMNTQKSMKQVLTWMAFIPWIYTDVASIYPLFSKIIIKHSHWYLKIIDLISYELFPLSFYLTSTTYDNTHNHKSLTDLILVFKDNKSILKWLENYFYHSTRRLQLAQKLSRIPNHTRRRLEWEWVM